ncbi:MAG: sigma 54-interacting transcriptional regulator [Lachnospiraceae bacterium]|nr:sigma 54-interacting transcriptional regulator [Lachnospiraceae bacterium]
MSLSQKKPHVLIVCINPYIRIEFQDYLHSVLGDHILFDTSSPAEITEAAQLLPYQCVLFSSAKVQSEFPVSIPDSISQIVCTRTFNHAFLDQIIRIPPGEKVYVVNDFFDSTLSTIRQFEEFGISQYQFIPYSSETQETDLSIRYAITVGEPLLVPGHIRNVINIGNRIIDISTINELCVLFHLPARLGNQITRNYISHILKVVKTAGSYYSSFVFSQQLLLATVSNLPFAICLLDENGTIMAVNKTFSKDWGLSKKQGIGTPFAHCLPEAYSRILFNQTADYRITNHMGVPMVLSVMELSFPNHTHVSLLTSKPSASQENGANTPPLLSDPADSKGQEPDISPIERQRSSFLGLITASERFQEVLSYARRLSLYDFPVLIQGESGTQKKMLARAIHQSSSRRRYPFVSLNQLLTLSGCDLPEVLETANHGTLLVDHIEKLSPKMQDFLVQLLQNTASDSLLPQRSWDIRVIATSAPNLYSLVQKKAFQENLFFQLSTAVLDTVPLKERREDIPLLLEHFFGNQFHHSRFQMDAILSKSLYQFLLSYDYPGNVKELMNLAQYFSSLYAAHPLILSQLPSYIREGLAANGENLTALRRQVLTIIKNTPKSGRASIQKSLAESGAQISDGKLRGLLKELSDQELILVHRTKGGCEITEAGLAALVRGG